MSSSQRLHLRDATWQDWQEASQCSRLPEPPEFQDYPAPYDAFAWSEAEFRDKLRPAHYEAYAIVLYPESPSDSEKLLGFVKAFDFSVQACECGIEILEPEDYGKGYASEAMQLFLLFLRQKHQLKTVMGLIHPQNKRSIGLFEKLNFKPDGLWQDSEAPEQVFLKYVKNLS